MPAVLNDFERACKTLHGLLLGIKADDKIEVKELQQLKKWLEMHDNLLHRIPFCELYEMIDRIVADGIVDEYEHEEIMQYCKNYELENAPYEELNEEMKILHGFIQGIAADNKIDAYELKALQKWLLYHESVIDKWPFNQLHNHLENILKDGTVTKKEERELLSFINSFSEKKSNQPAYDKTVFVNRWMETDAPVMETITNIFDKNVDISVKGKLACITGLMKVKRGTVIHLIIERGGKYRNNVTLDLDYLVIGALSNPCWKYSTYGGKIEKAMEYKKKDAKINIVSENDFLIALNS